jgi:L,D-transpeptidase catalytic domain/Putative peptidoglycan binding domain
MRKRLVIAAGILLALFGVALSAGGAYAYFWDSSRVDVIAPGVVVAGVDVGGLDTAQAEARVRERVVGALERPVRLTYGAYSFTVGPNQAGLRVDLDRMLAVALAESRRGGLAARFLRHLEGRRVHVSVPLEAGVSPAALGRVADEVATLVDRPARSATVVPTSLALRIVPERLGVAVRRETLQRALAHAVLDQTGARTIDVPTRTVLPRWTAETLRKRYPAYLLVDRETYKLRLFRGLKLAKTYSIAVGRAGLETPAGLYRIDDKQVNPSWHVPRSAWAGSLAGQIIPPGPADPIKARWMGFWNGAGIHGTDETWSIGHSASHGCIRMLIPDVIQLYSLVPLNTPIYVG